MTYNEALIDERDHGIAEIQQQIGEVNEIFQVWPSSPPPPPLQQVLNLAPGNARYILL